MKLARLLSYVRKAADDYDMIKDGDRIAVGVSGGKDSLALLVALSHLRRFYPAKFSVCAITVSMGFSDMDFTNVASLCKELDVPYHIINTDIGEIIFTERNEKNPCSLCSKMRKGALNDKAVDLGFNKVAFGHNKNDVIETFFLSLLYEGRIHAFSPVTYLDRKNIYAVRPLVYAPEKDILSFIKRSGIIITKNTCSVDGYTKRQRAKQIIEELDAEFGNIDEKVFGAIKRACIDGWGTNNN